MDNTKKTFQKAFGFIERKDLVEYLLRTVHEMGILGEDGNILLALFVFLSAKGKDPLNLGMTGESSVGKSAIIVAVSRLFEEKKIIMTGKMSKMSLIHDWDLARLVEEGDTKNLVIDLNGKVLVLLEEEESEELLDTIRPLLSHDKEEIAFWIVDKHGSGKHKTKKTIIRGWPAYVGLRASEQCKEEQLTRRLETSPHESANKHLAVNYEDATKRQYPWKHMDSTSKLTDKIANVKRKLDSLEFFDVINPFAQYIALKFPHKAPRSMRDVKRLHTMIEISANLHQKRRIICKIGDRQYVIATVDDYNLAVALTETLIEQTYRGISTEAKRFFYEILKPMQKSNTEITYKTMQEWARKIWERDITRSTLDNRYVRPLRNLGWLPVTNEGKKPLIFALERDCQRLPKIAKTVFGKVEENEDWLTGYPSFLSEILNIDRLTAVMYRGKEIPKSERRRRIDDSIRTRLIRRTLIKRLVDPQARYVDFLETQIDAIALGKVWKPKNLLELEERAWTETDYLDIMTDKGPYEWDIDELSQATGRDTDVIRSELTNLAARLDSPIRSVSGRYALSSNYLNQMKGGV